MTTQLDQRPPELTREQRVGAVMRTLGSFRVALGALAAGALLGLLWGPLLYVGTFAVYVLVLRHAWQTGEVLGRKQLTLSDKETKQSANERVERETRDQHDR